MDTPPELPTNSSGDESQKSDTMARRNTAKSFRQKGSELDLSAILNPDEVTMLQVLINLVLEDMQLKIKNVVDELKPTDDKSYQGIGIELPGAIVLNIPNPRSDKYRHLYGDIGLPVDKPDLEDREALREIIKPNILPATHARTSKPVLVLPKSPEEATAMSNKEEKDIFASSLADLRREVLSQFGKFRATVWCRVQDIVNGSNRVRNPQANSRRSGNTGRGRPARTSDPTENNIDYPDKKDDKSPDKEEDQNQLKKLPAYLHPPIFTFLRTRPRGKRALILHLVMLLILGGDQYTSYARVLLLRLSLALGIPRKVISQDEDRISKALAQIVKGIPHEEIAQRRADLLKALKRGKNSAVVAPDPAPVCNVLAAPLINAGIGTMFGRGLSPAMTAKLLGAMGSPESTVSVGTLFGLYGARQGGKMMDDYAKDVQDFAMVPVHGSVRPEFIDPKDVPAEDRRMCVTIGISGWTTQGNDFSDPWQILGDQSEVYALRWELETTMKMGTALEITAKNAAWTGAKREMADCNVFTSLQKSRWPTGLLKISKVVDNPWTVAMVRAEKAGLVLAEILSNKLLGERPVTLIGYSLGARIIYSCLMSLAEKRAFGIIENVVMMGAPCPSDTHAWAAMRCVVAGRLVNVWSKRDYLLGFLYRSCAWHYGIAGLQPIRGIEMVENVDVSDDIVNHLQYQYSAGKILKNMELEWEDLDSSMVKTQMTKLMQMIREEENLDRSRQQVFWQEGKVENVFFKQTQNQNQRHVKGQTTTQKTAGRMRPNSKENRRPGQGARS